MNRPGPPGPAIVQSDGSVLLEVASPGFEEARDHLARFADLEKCPEHVHTYRITPLSLWNAAASGLTAAAILAALSRFSRYPLPEAVERAVRDQVGRYGRLRLTSGARGLVLESDDPSLTDEVWHDRLVRGLLAGRPGPRALAVNSAHRGRLKQALTRLGYPVADEAGYEVGDPLPVNLRSTTRGGRPFALRPYQDEAVEAFHAGGSARGGSGVIVLPCGSGKTMVGLAAMARLGCQTLILATSVTAVRQWRDEVVDKTTLEPGQVGEYTGERKEIRPVTVSTYHILSHRRGLDESFPHLELFDRRRWGLIIYDEVHLLPAPVFRVTADLQARRRLGLTATLVREDGREDDVFSLIGPKRYDVPWKLLEKQGWIAAAHCRELRLPLDPAARLRYATADRRTRFRLAAENRAKLGLVVELARRHREDRVLIIGQYLDQLREIARRLEAPLVTGQVPAGRREELYRAFRSGQLPVLVVSRVANYALDLPDANVAVQVSGTFGSRQEEAQRLGRILRPKPGGAPAHFYSLVTRETREEHFAARRQLFLTEQGYRYSISDAGSGQGEELP